MTINERQSRALRAVLSVLEEDPTLGGRIRWPMTPDEVAGLRADIAVMARDSDPETRERTACLVIVRDVMAEECTSNGEFVDSPCDEAFQRIVRRIRLRGPTDIA